MMNALSECFWSENFFSLPPVFCHVFRQTDRQTADIFSLFSFHHQSWASLYVFSLPINRRHPPLYRLLLLVLQVLTLVISFCGCIYSFTGAVCLIWIPGPKTIKKNTYSTPNKSQTQRARAYEVMSFLSTDCELSTKRFLYSLGPRNIPQQTQNKYALINWMFCHENDSFYWELFVFPHNQCSDVCEKTEMNAALF